MKWAITILLLFAIPAAAAEQTGKLEGTIVSRNAKTNELEVDHGDVPGIMGAMAMSYEVRGAKVGDLPKDGSKITAILHESDGDYWLTDVRPATGGMSMGGTSKSGMPMGNMPGHEMQHGAMPMARDAVSALLMRQASGTSMNPAAASMHMSTSQFETWMLMVHYAAFLNQVVQSGPRGDDKLFSTNWIMGMADRPLEGGHLMLRSMLSLEPLTVGKKYPELFQTGETIDHQPIVDAQHPHDLFMELAAEFAHPLPGGAIGYVYAAPVGDPSLGPVAYPHRASAAEIPQAALAHHVQDSTHIAGSVITLGAQQGMFGVGVSGFHGREPDENRWNIDTGKIDSWAARFTFDPTPNVTAQISTGRLHHPEAAEPDNMQRTTASVAYSTSVLHTSFVFGHDDKTEGHSMSSWLAEALWQFAGGNYLTGRAEIVDKDELFPEQGGMFRIRALTVGYSRDVLQRVGVGANVTGYSIPRTLESSYGSSPHSLLVFVRLR